MVVFDGVGEEHQVGPLSVRYAPDADTLLERLAAGHRHGERVCLVSSDEAIRGTSGQEVSNVSSAHVPASTSSPQRTSRIRRHACAIASIPRRARSSNASAAVSRRHRRPVRQPHGAARHEHLF